MSAKVGESVAPERATEPATEHKPEAPQPLRCGSCRQTNHAGVAVCVFCGQPLVHRPGGFEPADPAGLEKSGQIPSEMPPSGRAFDSGFDDLSVGPMADPLIGVIVAERYRILEGLGRGGMGIVYRVEHTRIGKLLAMKLLTGELSRNPEVVRRFKHEALTSSKLSSPNTVQVFDFGVSDGLTYLVMELVAGDDLGKTLRTAGPLPFARLGKIIIQVCSSLSEAHHKGIVHRDIKPENIMLIRARDGTDLAKVLDFGLAKLREGPELNDVTSQGAIVGTPYFMSPEQVKGEPVDPRSDIYALGGVMYRALTGHYPFNGPTPMSVFTKHLTEVPAPLTEKAPERNIPRGVSDIVLKALQKNPNDRWQRIEDLQAALVLEMRALGTSSVENLLDSAALRDLAKTAAKESERPPLLGITAVTATEIATRDEVEAYERKLRRQRYGAYAVAAAVLLLGGAAAAARVSVMAKPEFGGVEIEPNNTAAEAAPVPFGRAVTGYLGRRIDPTHSDRDFFSIDVPGSTTTSQDVRLRVTSLPNMPMCTFLYQHGHTTALAQYCVGRPGRDLLIPQLRLGSGRYLVAITQDLDPYGAQPPFVHENVSDAYEMRIEAIRSDAHEETEPNDQVASADVIAPGQERAGRIAWARDEDVYCVSPDQKGAIRWKVSDMVRTAGGVVEVTPLLGSEEGAPVRVHATGNKPAKATSDVLSPWTSTPVPEKAGVSRCVRIRLANDPWTSDAGSLVPSGGSETYVVEATAVP